MCGVCVCACVCGVRVCVVCVCMCVWCVGKKFNNKSYNFPASNDNKTKIRKQDDTKSQSPCFRYKLIKSQRNKIHTTLNTAGKKS